MSEFNRRYAAQQRRPMTTKQIKSAFDKLEQVFYNKTTNHAAELFDLCRTEEKRHRGGFDDSFTRCHTADTISPTEAARMFAVKRVAEYILSGPTKYPDGQDYLHIQKSCFIAAAIADEFGAEVVQAWAGLNLKELASLDYTDFVKVRERTTTTTASRLTCAGCVQSITANTTPKPHSHEH